MRPLHGDTQRPLSSGRQPYRFLIRYRWFLCVVSLACTVFLAAGLPRLGFNSSWRIFFSSDNPHLMAYDDLTEEFSHYDNLILVVELKEGDLYTPENIETLRQITEKARQLPYALQVSSMVNYSYMEPGEEGLRIGELIRSDMLLDAESLPLLRKKVLGDSLLVDRLVNKEGTLTLVLVDLSEQFKRGDPEAIREVIDAGDALRDDMRRSNPDWNIYLFGTVISDASTAEASAGDFKRLFPVVVLFALLISYLIGRSLGTMAAIQVVPMCSVVAAVGFAGWLGYELNIVSTMACLLIAILALADTVHIGTTYLKERKPAVTNEEALNISLQKNLRAIFLTSLTTIAGLYSLNFVGSVAFAEMANIAIYGVVIAFVFSISLFPAILLLLTRKATYKGLPQQQLADAIADISVRYRKPLFIAFTILVIVTAPFIGLNRFNDDYRQFFGEDMDIRLAMEALIRHMEASNHIEYAIASGTEDGINNPAFLKKVEAFVDWYKEQPGITHVYSYVDFLKRLNQPIQDGNPAMYRIPETQELASQYLLLYEFRLRLF